MVGRPWRQGDGRTLHRVDTAPPPPGFVPAAGARPAGVPPARAAPVSTKGGAGRSWEPALVTPVGVSFATPDTPAAPGDEGAPATDIMDAIER